MCYNYIMNIFALHTDPLIAARYHNDKHVIKMILEYCQLLSTAHRVLDGEQTTALSKSGNRQKVWRLSDERELTLYKATHVNHPSAVWCRRGTAHYAWLHKLLVALCYEYTLRYGKVHKCQRDGLVDALSSLPRKISYDTEFSMPTPAMPEQYIVPDVVQSYRNYYIGDKQRMASWSGKTGIRSMPDWYKVSTAE